MFWLIFHHKYTDGELQMKYSIIYCTAVTIEILILIVKAEEPYKNCIQKGYNLTGQLANYFSQ